MAVYLNAGYETEAEAAVGLPPVMATPVTSEPK